MKILRSRPFGLKHTVAAVLLSAASTVAVGHLSAQSTPNSGARTVASQPYVGRVDATTLNRGTGQIAVPEDLSKIPLSPGFLVSLNVLDEPDLMGIFRVDDLGNLQLPVLGAIKVEGMSVTQAADLIRRKLLEEQILKNPQVTLNVLEYAATQVTILGEVASPGKYPLLVSHSLPDVLALAGGLTPTAGNEVEVVHAGEAASPSVMKYSRQTDAKEASALLILPGDTVRVKRAGIVYVLGAVMRPGGYVMQEDGNLNVLQAIALASGTSPSAATKTIHLLRTKDDGTVTDIPIPYKRLTKADSTTFTLQAKDVLFIPTSGLKAAFTNGSTIMGSLASATIYTLR
jgi:polysaccharide biosynthesis/export protein